MAAGTLTGAGVIVGGQRSARRSEITTYLTSTLAPLLGLSASSATNPKATSGLVITRSWTSGLRDWPGRPRRVRVRYVPGRARVGDVVVDIGDSRWVNELARQIGSRLGGEYEVARNDQIRGRLQLRLRTKPLPGEVPETAQVRRAKKVVNELLAGTAKVDNVDVDDTTGEVRRLTVKHDVGAKLAAPGYRNRVERTVSVMLPGRWRARWDMEADSVVFEVRPTLPESLWIPARALPEDDPLLNYRAVEIPCGVDEDGEAIAWRPAITPQWLITGETGSGKTSTGHGILTQITRFGWPVWIADGKGIEFLGFQDWPNVQIVASRIEEQVAVIHRAWQLMEHRYQLVVDRKARTEDFEPLMVFVDEFTDLKANLQSWYQQIKVKGDPTKPPTLAEVGSIARKGRTARVHLVLSMQRPDAEILTGEARENFGQRTGMGQLSPQGAQMMWNNPVTGVTIPRGRTGRAIGSNSTGLPVEMQCYRVPDPKEAIPGTEEYELLEQLRPPESRHERLLIVSPEIDWSGEEPVEPTFTDFAEAEWVKAADHPELDPIAWELDRDQNTAGDGRTLSSAMTVLGLDDRSRDAAGGGRRLFDRVGRVDTSKPYAAATSVPDAPSNTGTAGDDRDLDDDLYAGHYSHPTPTQASALQVGDLVCVDDDLGSWAVVEDEPIEDFDDPDSLLIAWRDDQDQSGELVVASEALMQARRPTAMED
ncbi:hypothetical protein [Nocardioides bruguierae]|uniref:FtsK domain-containing protein n=1 Tax=Nocardioides bruguierae TaxID=2945102 RepID=A0A9X2D9G8_9ACTN|nr:hypothetical protein [Nocardioides bruguierae]MCM0621791.1 hypothetical protein [Nocardioides bruguierae]